MEDKIKDIYGQYPEEDEETGEVINHLNKRLIVVDNDLYPEFYACNPYVEKVIISDSVTNVPENLFWECENLKQVIISNKVKSVDMDAFSGCESLKEISINHDDEQIWNDIPWIENFKRWCDMHNVDLIC